MSEKTLEEKIEDVVERCSDPEPAAVTGLAEFIGDTLPPTIPELKEQLRLARQYTAMYRERLEPVEAGIAAAVKAYNERLRSDAVYKDLLLNHTRAVDAETKIEETLRDALVSWYEAQPEPKVKTYFGDKQLSVRVKTTFNYLMDRAVVWCKTNMPVLIRETVDEAAFEATVQSLPELPEFVYKNETTTAVIAKELKADETTMAVV